MVLTVYEAARQAFGLSRSWRSVIDEYQDDALQLISDPTELVEEKKQAARSSEMASLIFDQLKIGEVFQLFCRQPIVDHIPLVQWQRMLAEGAESRVQLILSSLSDLPEMQLGMFATQLHVNSGYRTLLHSKLLCAASMGVDWDETLLPLTSVLRKLHDQTQHHEEVIQGWRDLVRAENKLRALQFEQA